MSFDAVVMVGFGGPESVDEVVPFLERVTAGRGIPPERLLEVGQHYLTLGGVSPINAQNRALLAALTERLRGLGWELPIVLANRNSAPFVTDVLAGLAESGHRRVLAFATSAYSSYSGCRQYREDLGLAVAALGAGAPAVLKLPPLGDVPGFLQALTELTRATLAAATGRTRLLFTTHSIPLGMAERSGPEAGWGKPGTYVEQHLAVARAIVTALDGPPAWELVYQSRSGPPHVPWLEPDINDVTVGLAGEVDTVVVVPIGFLTDHVEVIWDLDTQARQTADEHGLALLRVPTPGSHPAFLDGLAAHLDRALRGAGREASAGDLCQGVCCPGREPRPVVPGLSPADPLTRSDR